MDEIEKRMVKAAKINVHWLYSDIVFWEKASISYPDFNPFRAKSPIAVVSIPAIRDFKDITLRHYIYDGDHVDGIVT